MLLISSPHRTVHPIASAKSVILYFPSTNRHLKGLSYVRETQKGFAAIPLFSKWCLILHIIIENQAFKLIFNFYILRNKLWLRPREMTSSYRMNSTLWCSIPHLIWWSQSSYNNSKLKKITKKHHSLLLTDWLATTNQLTNTTTTKKQQ